MDRLKRRSMSWSSRDHHYLSFGKEYAVSALLVFMRVLKTVLFLCVCVCDGLMAERDFFRVCVYDYDAMLHRLAERFGVRRMDSGGVGRDQ